MDSIVRALAVYGFLLLLFRVSGKRSLAQITTFDAIVLLVISESVQQALIDGDESMTNAFILALTLLGADVILSAVSRRSGWIDRVLNNTPLLLIEDGMIHHDRLKRSRVTLDDVLERGRELRGVERVDQIKHAVLERNGGITVIPKAAALDYTS